MIIMLVDDMKKHRKAGVEDLTAAGHEVIAFSGYEDAYNSVRGGVVYDVALLDLLMPAEGMMLGGGSLQFLGQPIDVGFSLAMILAFMGIKRIVVATDLSHHHHPASAIVDWFDGKVFDICGAKVRIMHAHLSRENEAKDFSWALGEAMRM